jgi:hypothetical protein
LTPGQPDWRWRIINNAGEVVEESSARFQSIAEAVAEGAKRLVRMKAVDRSQPLPEHGPR